MQNTVEFLDAIKAKHRLKSDYELSKLLECTRGAISSYRTGRTFLDEEMACKVAADLGIDAGYVLACIASERARKPEVKAAWKHTAEMLYGLAAALALVAILPFVHLPATGLIPASGAFDNNGFYASQNIHYASLGAGLLFIIIIALLAFPKAKRDDSPRR